MHEQPSLEVNRRRATLLLGVMTLLWIVLLICMRMFPEHEALLDILATGAEAGMIGGLADWYAITVLFRDPFKYIWTPKIISEHTEIIPRNKDRIAVSMGRFVQENFLAPHIVRQNIEEKDIVLMAATRLADPANSKALVDEVRRFTPKLLRVFENPKIEQFFSQNLTEWLKRTRLNQPLSQVLEAIFANKIHHNVIQLGLDVVYSWVQKNPNQTRYILQKVLDESNVLGFVSRGATLIGFDIKDQAVTGIVRTLGELQRNPEHPIRKMISESMLRWMEKLKDDNSEESRQLEDLKMQTLENDTIVGFIMHVSANIRAAIVADLESEPSAIGDSLTGLIAQISDQLIKDDESRRALNHELALIGEFAAERYSAAIISYIQTQIQAWDTRFMIEKIESEVGGDLHMIRINGVVVGSMIGLALGVIQWLVHAG